MRFDQFSKTIDVAKWVPSPNFDDRDDGCDPEVIIIHCISLPPGEYGEDHIERFFQNKLSTNDHPFFQQITHLQVSAHFLIYRDGTITQFIPTDKRAWHAGESVCLGRPQVNNFSIGIELEGWDLDDSGFTEEQYSVLGQLASCLRLAYPKIARDNIFAHSDIAPGRKPDPGPYFSWTKFYSVLDKTSI
ncbi:MAG: 1,6-anhydro-N-acetylmuramyl-L-alanine amidase AmpD [Gammaproteobacteria bacterium]|nr:1,6-anhydro-N-acetylmuramyl-L-alanine amidase AmpD [Gammaproteobacteria bacterium]